MYNHLDPLFFRQTPAPRHSEPIDTHMAVQRHEQPPDRRQRGQSPHEEEADTLWEDSTRMSVAMLRAFLQNLLATQASLQDTSADKYTAEEGVDAPESTGDTVRGESPSAGQQHATGNSTSPARRAAQAYQSTARAVHDSNYDQWAATSPAIPEETPALSTHEIEVVETMIRDLAKLEARYIETLEIKETSNFLKAILDAIDHAMKRD